MQSLYRNASKALRSKVEVYVPLRAASISRQRVRIYWRFEPFPLPVKSGMSVCR